MCRKREGRVYIYKVDESLFFLVQKVVFKDSEFCSEKELEEGSKKGNKNFKKKKEKRKKEERRRRTRHTSLQSNSSSYIFCVAPLFADSIKSSQKRSRARNKR
jgi:hypothetical protein